MAKDYHKVTFCFFYTFMPSTLFIGKGACACVCGMRQREEWMDTVVQVWNN